MCKLLDMLPSIREQARFAFRRLKPDARADAIAEVVANCYVCYCRLVQSGKADLAYPTPMCQYAIRQFHDGRRVGSSLCIRDVLSPYAQKRKRFDVARLDRQKDGEWLEVVVEDRKAGPADTAAARIDISDWLGTQTKRKKRIAEALAAGHRTKDVARRFRLSPGRISQLRDELKRSWLDFQGE